MDTTNLPEKIHLEVAISILGLNHIPLLTALKKLIKIRLDRYGFPIYFDGNVLAEESEIDQLPPGLDDNLPDWRKQVRVKGSMLIYQMNFYRDDLRDQIFALIDTFINDGRHYHLLRESDSALVPLRVDYNNLYVLKEDLDNYKVKLDEFNLISFQHTKIEDKPLKNNVIVFTWEDLLINPPKGYSTIFEAFKQAVTTYIERTGEVPLRDQLWSELLILFGDGKNTKSISGISNAAMDRENFRSNYDRYTGKKKINRTS